MNVSIVGYTNRQLQKYKFDYKIKHLKWIFFQVVAEVLLEVLRHFILA